MKCHIGTDHPGARVQEFGAIIKPKNAKRLHFFVDGEEVFAKQVTIPARPYLRPALDENLGQVGSAIGAAYAAMFLKYAL